MYLKLRVVLVDDLPRYFKVIILVLVVLNVLMGVSRFLRYIKVRQGRERFPDAVAIEA